MSDHRFLSDFLDIWKATAIGVTGLLGIMGLLTEFRDSVTKKITRAGRITLVLIFVSSALGVLAQVVDSANQAEASKAQLDKLLVIASQTQASVHAANTLLTPISDPILEIDYRIQCPDPEAKAFCDLASTKPFYSETWPSSTAPQLGVLNLAFLSGRPKFDSNRVYNAELSFYALPKHTGLSVTPLKNGQHDVRIDGRMTVNDGGIITSFLQLQDRTMIISAGKFPLAGRVPYYVTVQNKNGQHIAIWNCEFQPLSSGPAFSISHKFTENVSDQVMPRPPRSPAPARDRANGCPS